MLPRFCEYEMKELRSPACSRQENANFPPQIHRTWEANFCPSLYDIESWHGWVSFCPSFILRRHNASHILCWRYIRQRRILYGRQHFLPSPARFFRHLADDWSKLEFCRRNSGSMMKDSSMTLLLKEILNFMSINISDLHTYLACDLRQAFQNRFL